jgi:hypothetical protein
MTLNNKYKNNPVNHKNQAQDKFKQKAQKRNNK